MWSIDISLFSVRERERERERESCRITEKVLDENFRAADYMEDASEW